MFDELKDQYQLLTAELEKPEVRASLKELGYDIASVVEAGGGLVRFAVENAGVLVTLATAVGAVSLALAIYKTAQLAAIIGARLVTLVAETTATGRARGGGRGGHGGGRGQHRGQGGERRGGHRALRRWGWRHRGAGIAAGSGDLCLPPA